MEGQYRYASLKRPGQIRLLGLLPSKQGKAPIQCRLFNHSLGGKVGEQHPFEALSYVWGSPEKKCSIIIESSTLHITSNLHTALSHLRHSSIERLLWVDAVCINQTDDREKEQQIGLMYEIYSCANCVLVWLGEETKDVNSSLEELRLAGSRRASSSSYEEQVQENVIKLLQRPWFRRIWVVQEVAAARRVQVLCGHSRIDGYVFCLAWDSQRTSLNARHNLYALRIAVQSIVHLMREAIFKPAHILQVSTGVRPFHELVDMFHSHEATEQRDKIYALLGMSSDDLSSSGLLPDYKIPFKGLFERLVKFVLSENVSVETRDNKEIAIIKAKLCVLGTIVSPADDHVSGGQQQVEVRWRDLSGLSSISTYGAWTLQTSTTPLRRGDLVCLVQGAKMPTIIRVHRDFSAILVIAATPPMSIPQIGRGKKWPEVTNRLNLSVRDTTLAWDWNYSSRNPSELEHFATWAQSAGWCFHDSSETPDAIRTVIALFSSGSILSDADAYENAKSRFTEGLISYTKATQSSAEQMIMHSELLVASHVSNGENNTIDVLQDRCHATVPQSYVSELFIWALRKGYREGVHLLLQVGDIEPCLVGPHALTILVEVARDGDLAIFERVYQRNNSVNQVAAEYSGKMALQAAAESGHLGIVNRLLQENVDVDAAGTEHHGRTALQAAAEGGHLAVVEKLLQHKADVNAAGMEHHGRTALQAAAEGGHLAVVDKLLQHKADVHASATRYNGRTALQAAAAGGHLAIVERLLQKKARVNAPAAEHHGRTALQAAAEGGHLAVIELLLQEGADINAAATENHGRTALQAAAEGGHLAVIELLLRKGADVNAAAAKKNGKTALYAAAKGGHLTIVELLLQKKADVDMRAKIPYKGTLWETVVAEHYGMTALEAAAGGGHLAIVERLLQKNARINAPAALQAAAEGGHLAVVELLIRKRADVNAAAAKKNGKTALYAAAKGGHLAIVEVLLRSRAGVGGVTARDEGTIALQAAVEGGHLAIAERLLQAETNTAMSQDDVPAELRIAAARAGHIHIIRWLLRGKIDIDAVAGRSGRTMLQAAAEGGHVAVLEQLLEEKADANAKAARHGGRTALQAAAEGGHLDIVNRLLRVKARVNASAAKYYGKTALQAAAQGGHLAIVERLLQEKADVNASAAKPDGKTALQAAAEGGHLAVIERLLQEKVKVNAIIDTKYGRSTALQAAAQGGHLAVVERLLQKKADINASAAKWDGKTALQAAAEGGHLAIIERLLQEKVNTYITRCGQSAALQAAAQGGHLAIVERLLQEKADVNASAAKQDGKTALQAAAEGGHLAIVERLLQEKADIHTAVVGHTGRATLQAAVNGNHFAVVERLLQEAIVVNAATTGYDGRTALQAAEVAGYYIIANVQVAVKAAAEGGYTAVVEWLLQADTTSHRVGSSTRDG